METVFDSHGTDEVSMEFPPNEHEAHARTARHGFQGWRSAGRGLLLAVVAGLVCVALLRAVTGLLEAAALCLLALVVASLALPRGLRRDWRQIRQDVPNWIAQLGEMLVRIGATRQGRARDDDEG